MSAPIRLLLLAAGRGVEPPSRPAGLQIHRCADTADLVGRVLAGAADAVAVSPHAAGVDAALIDRLRARGCRVLALVQHPSDAELARRIGLAEQVSAPIDPAVLESVLRCPPSAPAEWSGSDRKGRVVAVWGPPGAPGRTTVAALLAVGAVRSGRSVIVVDADLAGPAWSLMSVRPHEGADLAVALRRVASGSDPAADLLVPQAPDLDLLPLHPDPARWVEAAPGAVPRLLDALAGRADAVIVDVGADIRQAHPSYDIGWAHDSAAIARAAMAEADDAVAVLCADPVGVHRFAAWWPVLCEATADPVIAANKIGMPRAGRHPARQIGDVLAALGADGPRVDVAYQPEAADGLLSGAWPRARGWKDLPQRLWSGVAGRGGSRRTAAQSA